MTGLWWLLVAAGGTAALGVSAAMARRPAIGRREVAVFHALNGLPGWLHPLLWVPMQLGNLVVGTSVGLAIAMLVGDVAIAVGVVLAMVLKLITERIVRREMAPYLAVRQRPGTSQVGAILRGADVPATGPSFPSGHVLLASAVGAVVAPGVATAWWPVIAAGVLLVMLGRVYVGAHNPLDVTAGLGAGLLLGGGLAVFVG
jgi:undecaprenyl-diphosphatase